MIFLSEEWAAALVDSKCTKLMDWKFANLKSFVFVALIHPKPRQKVSQFSWLSFVDVKLSLCTTHNWWQRNERRPKNERSKVFLHFQVDASCILTWTSKLWARNNPNQPLPLGCKLQPSGKARSNLQTAAPGSKQHGLIRTKIECVQLLRVMAGSKGATKR